LNKADINRRTFLGRATTVAGAAHLMTPVAASQSEAPRRPKPSALARPKARPVCYTDEWRRTQPDFAVYLPPKPLQRDGYNDHFLVDVTPGGDLLAMWTQATYEGARDLHVVFSRSSDGGQSWSQPQEMAGAEEGPGMVSTFGFPVISRKGRIYCFFNKHLMATDGGSYITGIMRCKYSDDDGRTWKTGVDIRQRRTRFDHPDPNVGCKTIVWQKPIRDAKDRVIVGFSRWSSLQVFPRPVGGNRNHLDTQCELMRFDNIDESPAPKDIQITWLPREEGTIRVPPPIEPERSKGYSLAEEPGIVLLPDGRLFMTMRTVTGRIWYTVSEDDGASWRTPEILRYRDGGRQVEHPKSPPPLYRLSNGRYLLFFHNHDGHQYGATGPWDMDARRPLFLTVGEFRPKAHQPLWFSAPKLFCDTQGVGVGQENLFWLAMYASLTERGGQRIFWYPDRKHFLLGRTITDEFLADRVVPA